MRNAPESPNPLQDVVTGARAVGLGVAMGLIVYAADEADIALHEPLAIDEPTPVAVVQAAVPAPARAVYLPAPPKAAAPAPVPIYLQAQLKAAAPTAEPIPTF